MIRIVEDVVAPALVFGADYGTSELDKTSAADAIKWNRPVGIGLAALGYILGGWLGIGGPFVKNMGIASFDWGATSIVEYIKEAGGVGGRVSRGQPVARLASHRVGSYPAQPKDRESLWPRAV